MARRTRYSNKWLPLLVGGYLSGQAIVIVFTGFALSPQALVVGCLLISFVVATRLIAQFEPHGAALERSTHVFAALSAAAILGMDIGPPVAGLALLCAGAVSRSNLIRLLRDASRFALATLITAAVFWALTSGDSWSTNASTLRDGGTYVAITLTGAVVFLVSATLLFAVWPSSTAGGMGTADWSISKRYVVANILGVVVWIAVLPILTVENTGSPLLLVIPLISLIVLRRAVTRVQREAQATMESLADAIERRDPYTSQHSIRVTQYAAAILDQMPSVPALQRNAILAAARVHDLGKVATSDDALSKPGKLNSDERAEIEHHVTVGAEIVRRIGFYRISSNLIEHHHERWDGLGYPDGLRGDKIPLGARIIAVADAYDAMTSNRVYRAALNPTDAITEIRGQRGLQFDPNVVDAFELSVPQLSGASANMPLQDDQVRTTPEQEQPVGMSA